MTAETLFDPGKLPRGRQDRGQVHERPRKLIDPISGPFDWRHAYCRCGHHRAQHPCYHDESESVCESVDPVCERCRDRQPSMRVQLVWRGQSTYGLQCEACATGGMT